MLQMSWKRFRRRAVNNPSFDAAACIAPIEAMQVE
jgi:hypothetical protein